MHVYVRLRHLPSSKDGVEPYGKSVSLFCKLQVDLRHVKLSAMYPRWTMDDGTYNGDGITIVCSGAQVLALRKVKYDRLHHTRRKIVNIVSGRPNQGRNDARQLTQSYALDSWAHCSGTAVPVSAAWLILLTHPPLSDEHSPDFIDYTIGGLSQDMSAETRRSKLYRDPSGKCRSVGP
jgi:hypothetical protein